MHYLGKLKQHTYHFKAAHAPISTYKGPIFMAADSTAKPTGEIITAYQNTHGTVQVLVCLQAQDANGEKLFLDNQLTIPLIQEPLPYTLD